jgi:ATP-dependent helicase HrpA
VCSSKDSERDSIIRWDFDELAKEHSYQNKKLSFTVYPALVDKGKSVSICLFDQQQQANEAMLVGLRRLFMLHLGQKVSYLNKNIPQRKMLALQLSSIYSLAQLSEEILFRVIDTTFQTEQFVYTKVDFLQRLKTNEKELLINAKKISEILVKIGSSYNAIQQQFALFPDQLHLSLKDIQQQLTDIISIHFIVNTPQSWFMRIPYYLQSIQQRLEKLKENPQRENNTLHSFQDLQKEYLMWIATHPERQKQEEVKEYQWLLHELRISLFTQPLKTMTPVSIKRLEKRLAAIKKANQ